MSIPKEKGDGSSDTMPKTEAEKKDETVSAQDQVRQAQLKMQFRGMRKGDHETVEAYVKQLKSIANSLAAIGNPISDPDMVLQLLAGLPSQYLLLQNTISSRVPLPTFEEACSMLYKYESTLLLQDQSAKAQSANFSSSSNNAENSNSSKSSTTKETEIKKTVEMISEIASAVTTVASIARDFWNALPAWSAHSTSSTTTKTAAAAANTGNKKNTKKPNAGRGNYHKRGPSTTNSRNSGRK